MLPNETIMSKKNRFLLVYGSETGQAQAIAEEIAEKASESGLEAELHSLDQIGKRFNIESEKCMVIITSTTGDGDPPANASKFMRRIKKRTLSDSYLSHLQYALLGLGDTNYSNFCRCARDMDKRLEQLGATRFYPTGLADDGVGLEVVAEPWLEGLYPELQKFLLRTTGESPETCPASETGNISSEVLDKGKSDYSLNDRFQSLSSSDNIAIPKEVKDITTNEHKNSFANGDTSGEHNKNPSVNGADHIQANSSKENSSDIGGNFSQRTNSAVTTNGICDLGNDSQPPCELVLAGSGQTSVAETICVRVGVKDVICDDESDCCGLNQPSSKLEGKPLTVPALSPPFLSINFSDKTFETSGLSYQNNYKLPSAASEIIHLPLSSAQILTQPDAIKKTLLLTLNHKGHDVDYSPGDAISVICPNNQSEIKLFVERLHLLKCMDSKMTIDLIPNTKKRRAAVPAHIHSETTLRYVLTCCVSLRDPPSKAFLRVLAEYCDDEKAVRRLQELCSKEGASEYTAWIREKHISLLDLLYAFPSCQPPFERVLEFLPRLQPRPYSICSCSDQNPESFSVVFNVVNLPALISDGHFYHRRGVCTGWLDDITRQSQNTDSSPDIKIPIFFRTNQHFRPPSDLSKPIIMVGPGTGVAPFIGFLQHRASRKKQIEETSTYGETWLFFGCRNRTKDFLFNKDLDEFLSNEVLTKLCVAVSRDETEPQCYVQDLIQDESQSIARLILEEEALVYVCGDAQNMAKDVGAAFEQVLIKDKGMSADDAHLAIMKKRLHKTYLEDVWV